MIIVTGYPRSGTTLAMKLLKAGGISPIGPLNKNMELSYGFFDRSSNIKEYVNNSIKQVCMDGYDNPILRIPDTTTYKILMMRRNYNEINASFFRMTRKDHGFTDSIDTWLDQMFLRLGAMRNVLIVQVQYRELLADPKAHIQTISEKLALPLDIEKAVAVVDPEQCHMKNEEIGDYGRSEWGPKWEPIRDDELDEL